MSGYQDPPEWMRRVSWGVASRITAQDLEGAYRSIADLKKRAESAEASVRFLRAGNEALTKELRAAQSHLRDTERVLKGARYEIDGLMSQLEGEITRHRETGEALRLSKNNGYFLAEANARLREQNVEMLRDNRAPIPPKAWDDAYNWVAIDMGQTLVKVTGPRKIDRVIGSRDEWHVVLK